MKRILFALLILGVIFGGVFGWKMFVDSKIEQSLADKEPSPVFVAATKADKEIWKPVLETVGSLRAVRSVMVTGEISGIVSSIHFHSGRRVDKGELLVQLDTRENLAQLESFQAARDLAEANFKRIRRLVRRNTAPQSDLDRAKAELRQARANVTRQRVVIDKKKIKTPFCGIVGITKVDIGQYLSPGSPIVNLQAIAPIYVDFTLPQKHLGKVSLDQEITFRVDAWPEVDFPGRITAIDPQIDEKTRNIQVQGTLANNEHRLRPGMFGKVSLHLPVKREAITLPQTAVSYNSYGDVVFVLKPTDRMINGQTLYITSRQFVTTGRTRGDQVAINKGLDPGDLVVTVGHHKLKEGSKVLVNNSILPDNNPSPNLEDE